jgi:hypothetical protein
VVTQISKQGTNHYLSVYCFKPPGRVSLTRSPAFFCADVTLPAVHFLIL